MLHRPVLLFFAALAAPLAAQGLNGDPLDLADGSNWPHPPAPAGNPFPHNNAPPPADVATRDKIIRLGKSLFWDEQVSIDNTMACGTCHFHERGGTDGRLGAVFNGAAPNTGNFGAFGVIPQANVSNQIAYGFTNPASNQIARLVTPVHTPTMIGAYLFRNQFWDMRAGPGFAVNDTVGAPDIVNFTANASLEDQAVGPPISDVEMGHQLIVWKDPVTGVNGPLQAKLNLSRPLALCNPATIPADILPLVTGGAAYKRLFDEAFNTHPQFGGLIGVTRERFAMAIAHYERTLIPDRAPIDLGTMTTQQVTGFNFCKSNANCFSCHSSTGNPTLTLPGGRLFNALDNLFSDGKFHDINITPTSPSRKTTTLRNVGLHTKFFSTGHGGNGVTKIVVNNFTDLITFYDNQIGVDAFFGFNGTDPGGVLSPAERAAVTDFLQNALTDPRVQNKQFPFDRPQLASERPDFAPFEVNEFGNGTAGPSGLVPEIIANAPPHVSTITTAPSWFKVGVGNTVGNATAAVLVSGSAGPGPVRWVGVPFVSVAASTNAQGIGTSFNAVPLSTSAIGVPVFVQWSVVDGGQRATSDAAKFVPFQF